MSGNIKPGDLLSPQLVEIGIVRDEVRVEDVALND